MENSAQNQLRTFIHRLENIDEEKKNIAEDRKQVMAEAKAMGFDTKVITSVLRIRKQDADEREEHEALVATYLEALGGASVMAEAAE